MELFALVIFLTVLALASLVGWVADSRDGADWRSTEGGLQARRHFSS